MNAAGSQRSTVWIKVLKVNLLYMNNAYITLIKEMFPFSFTFLWKNLHYLNNLPSPEFFLLLWSLSQFWKSLQPWNMQTHNDITICRAEKTNEQVFSVGFPPLNAKRAICLSTTGDLHCLSACLFTDWFYYQFSSAFCMETILILKI